MAYLDRYAARRPNIAATAAVITIEAALAVAIVRGLGVTLLPHAAPDRTYAENVRLPEPSPSATPRHEHPVEQHQAQTPPLAPNASGLAKPLDPLPLDPPAPAPLPTAAPVAPLPMPTPMPLGKAAMPRGNPANWVSDSDYPSRDLREGNQGRVGFVLSLGIDGRVASCRVTSSSGHPGLDDTTCALVARRARFSPAIGPDGQATAGTYSGTIRWVIPD